VWKALRRLSCSTFFGPAAIHISEGGRGYLVSPSITLILRYLQINTGALNGVFAPLFACFCALRRMLTEACGNAFGWIVLLPLFSIVRLCCVIPRKAQSG
jgi:hypothetical protein